MKIRFIIYCSILFVALALPVVYKEMAKHIQEQEQITRRQKKDWLADTGTLELHLARLAQTSHNDEAFYFHYNRFLDYSILELEMIQEDLNNIKI